MGMVGTDLGFDAVLELCKDQHRRIVLGFLAENPQSMTMNDVTEAIVKHNHHAPRSAVSAKTITGIQNELHHVHLPKLADSGLIEYDAQRQRVEPAGQFDRIEPHLSALLDADPDLETPLAV